jgi:hypothetical protein
MTDDLRKLAQEIIGLHRESAEISARLFIDDMVGLEGTDTVEIERIGEAIFERAIRLAAGVVVQGDSDELTEWRTDAESWRRHLVDKSAAAARLDALWAVADAAEMLCGIDPDRAGADLVAALDALSAVNRDGAPVPATPRADFVAFARALPPLPTTVMATSIAPAPLPPCEHPPAALRPVLALVDGAERVPHAPGLEEWCSVCGALGRRGAWRWRVPERMP